MRRRCGSREASLKLCSACCRVSWRSTLTKVGTIIKLYYRGGIFRSAGLKIPLPAFAPLRQVKKKKTKNCNFSVSPHAGASAPAAFSDLFDLCPRPSQLSRHNAGVHRRQLWGKLCCEQRRCPSCQLRKWSDLSPARALCNGSNTASSANVALAWSDWIYILHNPVWSRAAGRSPAASPKFLRFNPDVSCHENSLGSNSVPACKQRNEMKWNHPFVMSPRCTSLFVNLLFFVCFCRLPDM